jgi:hypothetical protein
MVPPEATLPELVFDVTDGSTRNRPGHGMAARLSCVRDPSEPAATTVGG